MKASDKPVSRRVVAPWARVDASALQHPDLRACGMFSPVVFLGLVLLSKATGGDGDVPASALKGRYLAGLLHLPEDLRDDLEAAALALVEEGLLVPAGDHYAIKGWRRFQPDPTAPDRVARFRRKGPSQRDATPVTAQTVRYGDATGRDGTRRDASEATAGAPPPAPSGPRPRKATAKAPRKTRAQKNIEAGYFPDHVVAAARDEGAEWILGVPFAEEDLPNFFQSGEDPRPFFRWAVSKNGAGKTNCDPTQGAGATARLYVKSRGAASTTTPNPYDAVGKRVSMEAPTR